jgi:hypothetical protein
MGAPPRDRRPLIPDLPRVGRRDLLKSKNILTGIPVEPKSGGGNGFTNNSGFLTVRITVKKVE